MAKANELVRVYVWELPVRVSHWVLVATIAVLAFTGTYIHTPFIVATGGSAYVMGTIRYIHLIAASFFIAAFLLRLYWFFAGNRWARIGQFVPLSGERRQGLRGMMRYYLFFKWNPVSEVGHNALAGAVYLAIFLLVLAEIVTGLALYQQTSSLAFLGFLVGWVTRIIDIQWLRAIHYGGMFAFGIFVIHHVYSAIVISWEEKSGLVDSIFTGYKFIDRDLLERKGVTRP